MDLRRAVFAAVGALAVVGCGGARQSTPGAPASIGATVSPSVDTASASATLSRYLQALQAGDCAAARGFGTDSFTAYDGNLCGITVSSFSPPLSPAVIAPDDHDQERGLAPSGPTSMPDGSVRVDP